MKLKPRPQYLSKLVAAQDNSLIKVITGMRRCGKSSLLTLFRQHLLQQGIAEDHIIMMNLESFQYSSFTFEDLHNAIADRMQQDDHYYLLLDEVQLVDKWERAVNALHTDADVDITITGSNAYLLSSQLATLLSGRYMEINVFPLSFAEFMAYADLTDENAAFERYTRYGGLPPVVNQGTDQNLAYTVLSGIYDTILVRDISQFLQVRNPLVFNDVARYLADTAGSPVSTSKIENRLRSAHRPASNETIERYISGLLNAFLFYNAQRINVKGGAYLQGLAKYYPADLGIRNMLLGYSIEDFGFLLENAVHNELKIRGYQIRVGKIGKAEIDFVATRKHADLTEEKLYIQVSASILDEHTRERELSPLLNARDLSAKRMVLTLDRFGLGKSDGTSYIEDRELGTKRSRAAIMMETGLPGSVYVYQGEELGLFEVADIPWDRLEDPTPYFTTQRYYEKGRDGCRVPMPWIAADKPTPASWNESFGDGASFGFSPVTKVDGTQSERPHLPQPLWYGNFTADSEAQDPDSMLSLYRAALAARQDILTATADTSCTLIDVGDEIIAYTRPAADGRTFASYTNFGKTPASLPNGEIILASGDVSNGQLPQDTTIWMLL